MPEWLDSLRGCEGIQTPLGIAGLLHHGLGQEVDNVVIGPSDAAVFPNRLNDGGLVANAESSVQKSSNRVDRGQILQGFKAFLINHSP